MEFSNAGFIVIADAEMDAKEDGEDKKEEDKKNDGNKDVPATSLERKKRKRKNTRTTAQRQKKKKEKEGNSKINNMRFLRLKGFDANSTNKYQKPYYRLLILIQFIRCLPHIYQEHFVHKLNR